MSRTVVHRYGRTLGATLSAVALGLAYAEPALFVLAVVPLGYVAAGALSRFPEPTLEVERSLSPAVPAPGAEVTVTLTVTNTGDRTLPDVRVVDGVPDGIAVADGPARGCLSLSPGESGTVTYSVVARRGVHAFEDPTVRCRSLTATRLVTTAVEAGGNERLRCETAVEDPPPARPTRSRAGSLPTDSGGPGLTFHSTREYRPGDPTSRIDWRRLARTDTLSTINFREQQSARVVLVVDARPPARVAPEPGHPTGAELAGYAAERAYDALTGAGHQAAVTALGVDSDRLPWVPASADGGSAAEARALFERVHEANGGGVTPTVDGPIDPDPTVEAARTLTARLPPDAEVIYCSPLLDDHPVSVVEAVREQGYPVTVLSPDVTAATTPGGRLVAAARADRTTALSIRGVTVVDWDRTEDLDTVLLDSLPEVTGR